MFDAATEAQRDAITVVVFIGTFFVALGIGRFLKRRAGVQLGLFFRLFCLILAFYAAIAAYGVHAPWRYHVGAAAILLSTALVVALVNRYVWDFYFEKKRQTAIPHFLREVVGGVIFLIVLLVILSYGYHAETQLKGLLAGSGVVAIIVGFAGQNLFAGIIGGVSIQINRPFKVGDWLKVGDTYGEVREINWRSTRLCTNDDIYLDIPNNEMVSHQIVNLHYPTEVHAMRIRVGIDYNVPPNRVKDALGRAAQRAKNVLPNPPVKVFLVDFSDYAMTYEIKFYLGNHSRINEINDSVRSNVWYELKRQGITIGEPVIEEGAAGESMFVMLRGAANVLVSKNGSKIQVATLGAGDCFGEMSLLTGEPRSATVRADGDCYVMEIGKPVMAKVLSGAPTCMEQLSQLLAQRKMETEGILKEATSADEHALTERQYTANFLHRLRTFFQL